MKRRLLLDTHVFIWWLADSERIGPKARALIADPENEIFVSGISGLEISMKWSKGQLEIFDGADELEPLVELCGFEHLPVTFSHGEQSGALPHHHRDPFDRILIAQAQAEGMILLTDDGQINQYVVRTLSVSA
ncbi:MAG: type II toxin-antitoxin system VapC family toxin [Nitrococcus mobilis]|nr:type II toxin-antitoxin system VapC family toxin [Nitrococcus mobilis]